MSTRNSKFFNRRDFLKLGSGIAGAFTGGVLLGKAILEPDKVVQAARPMNVFSGEAPKAAAQVTEPNLHLIASDGWIYLPPEHAVPPYHPDNVAPAPLTTYIFGYRDVTGLSDDLISAQKMKAQLTAPVFHLHEGTDFTLKLTNLGLQVRPDLIDAHTLHFHGFRNAIPIFDGEPHSSVGVPIIRDLTYFYRPRNPGTYMYHCHFEETEHVHMGMVGGCYITPKQNNGTELDLVGNSIPAGKYVYNDHVQPDDPRSTAYDREFVMCLNEVWTEAHWADSHIQLPEWSDYEPDFFLLNGRVYPDTLAPNGGGTDPATGDLIPPDGHPELKYQPISSLVTANAGDRVLLRFMNMGFKEQTMTLAGIKMRVIGMDATMLQGSDGTDLSYTTHNITFGAGESRDVIFKAPVYQGPGEYDRYLLYNRNYGHQGNGGGVGYGGQMTEVRVYPAGTLPPQSIHNT